jgi:type VI secretion system protein VasD
MPGKSFAVALALLTWAGAGSGCSWGKGSGQPAPIDVTLQGAARLNPDQDGQSLPTSVRLYQLKGKGKLEAAEFDQLYRNEKAVLGEDLLRVEEVTVSPGETVRKQLPREPGCGALGVVAVVRRPSGANWRVVSELPEKSPQLVFVLEEYRVERR